MNSPMVPPLEESCILYTNVERMAVHHDGNDGKAKVLCPTTLTRGTRHGLRGIVDIELEWNAGGLRLILGDAS